MSSGYELIVGDCRTELAALPDASVDAAAEAEDWGACGCFTIEEESSDGL